MGIFDFLKKKETAEEIYWKENATELKQIEIAGANYVSKLNIISNNIDTDFIVHNIIDSKSSCLLILDWFHVLDERKCPYHLIGTAESFKRNLLERYNTALIAANKTNHDDFILVRDSLCKEASNYSLCQSELTTQASKGNFYGTPQRWVNTVKGIFEKNQSVSFLDLYVICGMPHDIAYSKNALLLNDALPIKKDTNEYDVFFTYEQAISNRYMLQHFPLTDISDQYNLNLLNNERILHRINLTKLFEEKVVRRNIAYSGVRWSNGLLRAGTISAIGNEIKDFVPQDIGRLFITNKRIIFVGKQNNITKAISISNVLFFNLYQDGILLNQANKKAVLLKFDQSIDTGIYHIGDGLNEFVITLNRILNNTENDNITN